MWKCKNKQSYDLFSDPLFLFFYLYSLEIKHREWSTIYVCIEKFRLKKKFYILFSEVK